MYFLSRFLVKSVETIKVVRWDGSLEHLYQSGFDKDPIFCSVDKPLQHTSKEGGKTHIKKKERGSFI